MLSVKCLVIKSKSSMINLRKYNSPPYNVAVIHGGPGAGGEMAPVARELASVCGVLEPIQTATSLNGQVDELKTVLEKNANIPVTLVGFSWGAWLSFIVAATYPILVKKLLLIGSGGFEEKYGAITTKTRLNRLSNKERTEYRSLIRILVNSEAKNKDAALTHLGELVAKTDAYDPVTDTDRESDFIAIDGDLFQSVWSDAVELRKTGKLLDLGRHINCPVVAIHGNYDPHPADGVQHPLSNILKDFRFIVLEKCGHRPWIEKHARDRFYEILKAELKN